MKWPGWLTASITHPVLGLLLRVYIGGVFVYASMYKIDYPGEFAETITSYQLIPYWAVNLMALTMPWAELTSGVLMVLGVRTKSADAAGLGAALPAKAAAQLSTQQAMLDEIYSQRFSELFILGTRLGDTRRFTKQAADLAVPKAQWSRTRNWLPYPDRQPRE